MAQNLLNPIFLQEFWATRRGRPGWRWRRAAMGAMRLDVPGGPIARIGFDTRSLIGLGFPDRRSISLWQMSHWTIADRHLGGRLARRGAPGNRHWA